MAEMTRCAQFVGLVIPLANGAAWLKLLCRDGPALAAASLR